MRRNSTVLSSSLPRAATIPTTLPSRTATQKQEPAGDKAPHVAAGGAGVGNHPLVLTCRQSQLSCPASRPLFSEPRPRTGPWLLVTTPQTQPWHTRTSKVVVHFATQLLLYSELYFHLNASTCCGGITSSCSGWPTNMKATETRNDCYSRALQHHPAPPARQFNKNKCS